MYGVAETNVGFKTHHLVFWVWLLVLVLACALNCRGYVCVHDLHCTQAHLKTNGILIVEVGDLRPAVEAAYPRMPFTWLTTSQGDDMVFLLRKNDFERLIPASAKSSASSAAGPRSGRNAAAAADAHGAMEDAAPFAATLSKIASGKRKL